MLAVSYFLLCINSNAAHAWYKHASLMPWILRAASPELKISFSRPVPFKCTLAEKNRLTQLIRALRLNPNAQFPSLTDFKCDAKTPITVSDILLSHAIDDPDQGMDRDLPTDQDPVYDPTHARKWMGGTEGFSSQGFRHMYFGGWRVSEPITTLQYPTRPLGQAPERVETLARKAKELIKAGDLLWGIRLLSWAIHYTQDLNQPFHSVQTPSWRMVPWSEAVGWPSREAWSQFLKAKERTLNNFHWALEGYTLDQVLEGKKALFADCLAQPRNFSHINYDPKFQSPLELALASSDASVVLAGDLGAAEVRFFGSRLLMPDADLTQFPNLLDYKSYARRPDLIEAREEFNRLTCRALANSALGTLALLEWAFQP
jgi:hypothetical protein